jgi:hypothetical protein
MFLQNVSELLLNYTMSHPRSQYSSILSEFLQGNLLDNVHCKQQEGEDRQMDGTGSGSCLVVDTCSSVEPSCSTVKVLIKLQTHFSSNELSSLHALSYSLHVNDFITFP